MPGETYVLNQTPLVLECVALGEMVQLVVQVLVNLPARTVLDEQSSEDSHAAHPQDLTDSVSANLPDHSSPSNTHCNSEGYCQECGHNVRRHSRLSGTFPLAKATVATDPAGEVELTRTRARVHGDRLADDEAIGDELADGLARVGVADLADLVGVEPNLALAAVEHRRREALLSS
jgi:hypothetical protein